MTGKQIQSIVHRLEVVAVLRERCPHLRDEKKALHTYRAANCLFNRTYRDALRWMTRAQFDAFDRAEKAVDAHRAHARAKRQPRAA